jgi:hypothetical protein
MSSLRSQRVLAIYNKMISIAQKGSINYLTYYNYIDDLLSNNEYMLIQDVFTKYFKTDIRQYTSIPILKQQSWAIVLANTATIFMYRLKSYYDSNNVHQIGQKIYDSTDNELLGTFVELERQNVINFSGITYSFPPYYKYYDNTDLYQLSSVTYSAVIPGIATDIILQVQIGAFETDTKVYLNDITMSLLDKYKLGIQLLINDNPSINSYIENNYIENYLE